MRAARPDRSPPAGPAVPEGARRAARLTLCASLTLALAGCAGGTTGPLEQADLPAARAVGGPSDSWLAIGRKLLAAGESDLARGAFERSLLIEGPSAEAMTGAGIAAERQGLVTMAARYFERARDLAPDSVVANNNLGVVRYRLNEYYRARQAFQAAFALSDGRNELALRNLRLAERAIADIEAGRNYVDPAVNFEVRRLGSSEFELIESAPPEAPDAAAPPAEDPPAAVQTNLGPAGTPPPAAPLPAATGPAPAAAVTQTPGPQPEETGTAPGT